MDLIIEPYETTDTIQLVSDNPSILSVKYTGEEQDVYGWSLTPLKKGLATITLNYGKMAAKCVEPVYESEDEYYDSYYLEKE